MNKGVNYEYIYIHLPLVAGHFFNLIAIYFFPPPILTQIVFLAFWLWVGFRFAALALNKLVSFIVGHSLWLLSLLLFLWQFVLVDDESRNLFLAGMSQNYIFGFLWSGVKWVRITNDIHFTTINVTIASFIMMFLTFTVGFVFSWIIQKRKQTLDKNTIGYMSNINCSRR